MAGPTGFINFDIVGNRAGVQKMLLHLDSSLSPVGMYAFMHGAVQPWLVERAEQRFAGEGDDAVGKWAPLMQSTIMYRESAGFGGPRPINKRTGELEAYITGGGADVTSLNGASVLTFPDPKTKMSYGLNKKVETAQVGRSKNPSTVKRPVLGLGEKDLAAIMTRLAFHVQGWKSK